MKTKIYILFLIIFFSSTAQALEKNFTDSLYGGAVMVKTEDGKILLSHHQQKLLLPASILKIATSLYALDQLGQDYRFKTNFYLDSESRLVIEGLGDPSMTSEELRKIASILKKKGIVRIGGIVTDGSFFDENLITPGISDTDDPYNAINGALIANFNTVYAHLDHTGFVKTAEFQTPLTPLAMGRRRQIKKIGKLRINLGLNQKQSSIYVGELLKEFLIMENIVVDGNITYGKTPKKSTLIYQHQSSKNLADIIKDCLEYSTNFIANQLFLNVSGQKNSPVTWSKAREDFLSYLKNQLKLNSIIIEDGSGLSRNNQISALEMMTILDRFYPYKNLLHQYDQGLLAKTGSLNDVNTLAGYFPSQKYGWVKFVILVNKKVPFDHRFRLADQLMKSF